MNFNQLRHKHRFSIIHHATRLYGIKHVSAQQQQSADQYLANGDLQALLTALKGQNPLPGDLQPAPATKQECTGSITVCDSDLTFSAGEARQLKVEVKNLSTTTWQTDELTPVFLSYHWYAENGEECDYDGRRTPLPKAIQPGGMEHVTVNVQPFNGIGTYLLELTMVMEGKFWFENCGLNTRRESVKISPPKLPRHANSIYNDLMVAIAKRQQGMV